MKILVVSSDRTDEHGGACNLGDAFLTDALVAALRDAGHTAEVVDFGAAPRTTSDGARAMVSGLRGLDRAVKRSEAVIVGGGTLFQDDQPDRLVGGLPRLCAAVAFLARRHRRPVGFYGVGLDPIERRTPRALVGYASRMASEVWLRESDSCARYSSYFGREAALGADASLLALTVDLGLPDLDPTRGTATIALNRSDARTLTETDVAALRERWPALHFLAMDQQSRNSDALALPAGVGEQLKIAKGPLGWREVAQTIARSEVVVASRMHALYLAIILGVPAVAVGNHPKVRSFAQEFGIPLVGSLALLDVEERGRSVDVSDAVDRARIALRSLENALGA